MEENILSSIEQLSSSITDDIVHSENYENDSELVKDNDDPCNEQRGTAATDDADGDDDDDDSVCSGHNQDCTENLTLSFYSDDTHPFNKEKVQLIWDSIESKPEFKEIMVNFNANNRRRTNERCRECKNHRSINEEEQTSEVVNEEKVPKRTPQTAIELLDHFRELHMVEECIRKAQRREKRFDSCLCDEDSQESSKEVLNQIKNYEKNMVTHVIGEKRTKNMFHVKLPVSEPVIKRSNSNQKQ